MTLFFQTCLFPQIGSLRDMYHFVKHDSAGTFIKEMVNGPNGDLAVGLVNHPEVIMNDCLL